MRVVIAAIGSRGDVVPFGHLAAQFVARGHNVVLVTHDPGAVEALQPDRVLVLPDGVEDLWSDDYAELVDLA